MTNQVTVFLGVYFSAEQRVDKYSNIDHKCTLVHNSLIEIIHLKRKLSVLIDNLH